jgi:hypothetical protein
VLNASLVDFRYQNVLGVFEVSELAPGERESAGEGWGERQYRVRLLPIPAFCEMKFLCDSLTVVSAVPVQRDLTASFIGVRQSHYFTSD